MSDYRIPSLDFPDIPKTMQLVDVRKAEAHIRSGLSLPGAVWINPFDLGHGHPILRSSEPLAFFCVHGREVSQFAAALGRFSGLEAFYIRGGFEAMVAKGCNVEQLA